MNLKVLGYENDECANINGTHLVGEIKTTYDKLVEKFGQPTYTEDLTHMRKSPVSGLLMQQLSKIVQSTQTMIISTNHLLCTVGKKVASRLKSTRGISVDTITKIHEIAANIINGE